MLFKIYLNGSLRPFCSVHFTDIVGVIHEYNVFFLYIPGS